MKILIIGGGNMGMTYAQSFLKSHTVSNDQLFILEKTKEKADNLRQNEIGQVYGRADKFISEVQLIILAVKPQDIKLLFEQIKPFIKKEQVFLSIMAGVTTSNIKKNLGVSKIIRAMPNLPTQIGFGMTVFTSTNEVNRSELISIQNLLNSTGKTIYVEEESRIDSATAISGSGPAYVFFFMQNLIKSAQQFGFSHAESELLTYQTFRGTVALFNAYDFTCEEWIDKVSSKGGTTEAAFNYLQKFEVDFHFVKAVAKAFERAKELGQD